MDRLLAALDCPFRNAFNVNNRKHVITLVSWLEDRIIRECEIVDRNNLKGDE